MNKKNTLILACALALVAVFAVTITLVIKNDKTAGRAPSDQTVFVRQDTLAAEKTAEEAQKAQQPKPPAQLGFLPYGAGLYSIDMQGYESAQLSTQFDFIAEGLKSKPAIYADEMDIEPELPPYLHMAGITIPSKNLEMVALYTQVGGDWCNKGFCIFRLYIKRPQGYQLYLNTMTTAQNYLLVDDKSVSVIMCDSRKGYRQWRLADGALDKPLPANAPGYFVSAGHFTHDKIAACP